MVCCAIEIILHGDLMQDLSLRTDVHSVLFWGTDQFVKHECSILAEISGNGLPERIVYGLSPVAVLLVAHMPWQHFASVCANHFVIRIEL